MDKKFEKLSQRMKEYMDINAMSRYEEPVVDALKKNIVSPNYEYSRDGFGSLIIKNKPKVQNAPKVMVVAHMDEVGFLVRSVEENGNILLSPVGGVWPTVVIGTKAKLVTNKENKTTYGIFGHTSIHILERDKVDKAINNNQLFLDCGFNSKKEVEEFGIEIGDRVYMSGESVDLPNNLISGKAVDNRAGVTILDFLANNVKDLDLNCELYMVGSVQEEVGCRGARTSVSLINPDVAFAIDTGACHDTTGAPKGTPELGKGVALLVKDGEVLTDPRLISMLEEIAAKHNIPVYKYIAVGGGTDGAALQYGQGGVPTITLSIPQRYLHSPIGVCSLVDMQATIDLITEFVKAFDTEQANKLKWN